MLKKLHVNIPFIDALSQMLMYFKLLNEILFKKRKIDRQEIIALVRSAVFWFEDASC